LLTTNLAQVAALKQLKREAPMMNVHEELTYSEEKGTLLDQFITK